MKRASAARASRPAGGPDREPAVLVRSVARALHLLDALADSRREVGIAELARRVGLHISTVHRVLATLVVHGYARQDAESGRYALGPRAFRLGGSALGHHQLRQAVRPVLEALSESTGETANLVALDGGEVLYLDTVEGSRSLRTFALIGHRAPLHCTATGKVLLAFRERETAALLEREGLPPLTRRTVTSPAQLRRELARVRRQGFALDRQECEEGACCVAAPLRDVSGEVVAAIGISGPAVRMPGPRLQDLAHNVMAAAQAASARLGFQDARGRHAERVPAVRDGEGPTVDRRPSPGQWRADTAPEEGL